MNRVKHVKHGYCERMSKCESRKCVQTESHQKHRIMVPTQIT